MSEHEIDAFKLLANCTFLPGTSAKRFVRQMSELADKESYKLSESQTAWLWKLVWMYRKQHRNKWFIYYAHEKAKIEKSVNPKDYL